jgi:SAM-dependent methyltransferase
MLKTVRTFARICSELLPIVEPIYEFGALQVPGQEAFADLRPLFGGLHYVGTDLREGPGVDKVIDLQDIALPDESVGTAISLETLEHVEYPRKAITNIHRVLKLEGLLMLSVPMNLPIHNYPYDYWRFTPAGVESLLKPFQFTHVDKIGDPDFPTSVVAVAAKRPIEETCMERFKKRFQKQQEYWKRMSEAIEKRGSELEKA